MTTNYMQIVEQSDEDKLNTYMKLDKEELAKMLIQANKHINHFTNRSFKNSPIHDKAAIIAMLDELSPERMIQLVAWLMGRSSGLLNIATGNAEDFLKNSTVSVAWEMEGAQVISIANAHEYARLLAHEIKTGQLEQIDELCGEIVRACMDENHLLTACDKVKEKILARFWPEK